ncbi:MAG: hypothetical protein CMC93_06515 [Flavobacteriaceae bacterium]|nr:hypothetical protein [Flavobacteriaceae bacterium]
MIFNFQKIKPSIFGNLKLIQYNRFKVYSVQKYVKYSSNLNPRFDFRNISTSEIQGLNKPIY